MAREIVYNNLIRKIGGIAESNMKTNSKLQAICDLLKNNVPEYDWVGFYWVDMEHDRELILGPFAGEPTEHKRIKFGEGICGQAAETEKTFIIDDVSKEENYLSCGINVKSEIVVPIFRNGLIIGELDIDSHAPAAFSKNDEQFLTKIGEIASQLTS
ncbi:MAG: GAF domain-containing protein [Candidatus Zixiibacteriota bacterium]